jgi:hypothetical protein
VAAAAPYPMASWQPWAYSSGLASGLDRLLWSSRDAQSDQLRPHLRRQPKTPAPRLRRAGVWPGQAGGGGGI